MIGPIEHRGPDGTGTWTWNDRIGFAHARLAIIDPSPNANQPMLDASQTACITFNGEIYNFRDLRAELENRGHRFQTRSDTEVILAGYREWGDGVVDRLRGMFAFGLWDIQRRRLLLARDPVGEKPLVYAQFNGTLLFASAIRALLAWPGFEASPNLAAIDQYLRRVYVPTPLTSFNGISKLPPGSMMSVEANGACNVSRYWRPRGPGHVGKVDRTEIKQELLRRIDASVSARLVSDVPLGAFLSGGVDSSAIVSSMVRASSAVKTFTVGFSESTHDERPFARVAAQHFGTDHRDLLVKPDAASLLPKLAWHYNEPFADSSALPTYYLAEFTRNHVTVALTGDGGDEAFAGYPFYFAFAAAGLARAIVPRAIARAASGIRRTIDPTHSRHKLISWLGRVIGTDGDWAKEYSSWSHPVDERARASLYEAPLLNANAAFTDLSIEPFHAAIEGDEAGWLEQAIRPSALAACADMNGWLPDQLLVKMDVASMAHGLETRAPFLDRDLLDFAATIPQTEKLRGLRPKSLLKEALHDRLPASILTGKKKGFQVPVAQWLRSELKDMMIELLLTDKLRDRGLLNRNELRRMVDDHLAGRHNYANRLWGVMMLELWFRTWIDNTARV